MADRIDTHRTLGEFLRNRREHLSPAAVGLQGGTPRRRTPGLRREEVALLCGLSPTWYTWLEQGRDISLSPAALVRVALALKLTAAERAYVFELAERRDPSTPRSTRVDAVPTAIADALLATRAPAYVLDRAWNAAGFNDAARRLLSPWLGSTERNLLRFVFNDVAATRFIRDWKDRARRLVAEFRADTARRANDPEITAMIDELAGSSATFAALWHDHRVLSRDGGMRDFNVAGKRVRYEQLTLVPPGAPDLKLVMLLKR